MIKAWKVAVIAAAALVGTPAISQGAAQDDVTTATQDRNSNDFDEDILWNILGLMGLLGLRGLWRDSDNDGYTEDPV